MSCAINFILFSGATTKPICGCWELFFWRLITPQVKRKLCTIKYVLSHVQKLGIEVWPPVILHKTQWLPSHSTIVLYDSPWGKWLPRESVTAYQYIKCHFTDSGLWLVVKGWLSPNNVDEQCILGSQTKFSSHWQSFSMTWRVYSLTLVQDFRQWWVGKC